MVLDGTIAEVNHMQRLFKKQVTPPEIDLFIGVIAGTASGLFAIVNWVNGGHWRIATLFTGLSLLAFFQVWRGYRQLRNPEQNTVTTPTDSPPS
jgi:hypothetical protein